jgi:hypothetical protein
MRTLAEVVNLISGRLHGVVFERIVADEFHQEMIRVARIQFAHHRYLVLSSLEVDEIVDDTVQKTAHSVWVQGILKGKVRNESGELS